ncbi:hypothetical protein L6164_000402 [Bauhinia variegata]|uniref:Uncharacterized protein n=1 Tax=Bauhinia variegata TaxID=167791 RepID=A0ACB9Q8H8_BAUVA|nr:hypothetical protein L6164_000402 [Bauhinia variegata]
MAEIGVDLVLDKLSLLLRHQAEFPRRTRSVIESMEQLIAPVTKDHRSPHLEELGKAAVDYAYLIEDIIDDHIVQNSKQRYKWPVLGFLGDRKDRNNSIACEILSKLREDVERYRLLYSYPSNYDEPSPLRVPNIRFHLESIEEADLVGTDAPSETLINLLRQEGQKRMVIAAVGPAGIGKTTSTRKVYTRMKELSFFDCQVWISLSSLSGEEELRRVILAAFPEIRARLQDKRYLIVFDDVNTIHFSSIISSLLPENHNGSKIMIATKDKKVAEACKRGAKVHIHELEPLREEAIDLFFKRARVNQADASAELKNLSHDIVNICKGIPMVIVPIANSLSEKEMNYSEWLRVRDNLNSFITNNPDLDILKEVLLQGYLDLPYNLKQCLLYWGLFPEDYAISSGKLIRLWVAEGFVAESSSADSADKRLEDVARDYLRELINRSLVEFDHKSGRCRIYHLLHQIMVSKSKDLKFDRVNRQRGWGDGFQPRRLSIYTNVEDAVSWIPDVKRVRSCFLYDIEEFPKISLMQFVCKFKLLKVLSFENAPISSLPKHISQLVMLKYLSIRNTRIETLPESIGTLCELQTLDLKYSLVKQLPEISKLINLRHLLGCYQSGETIEGVKVNPGIGKLQSLQTLFVVDASDQQVTKEIENLKQLQKLGITNITKKQGRSFFQAIQKMNHLRSLSIRAVNENEFLHLESLKQPPPNLSRLYLEGRFHKLPTWIRKLKNLLKICLNSSELRNPLNDLEKLPNLLEISLHNLNKVGGLHFREGRLERLRILRLSNMLHLKSLRVDKGALPRLEILSIGQCPELVEMPTDIQHLRILKDTRSSGEFMQNMEPDENYGLKELFADEFEKWEASAGKEEKDGTSFMLSSKFSPSESPTLLLKLMSFGR